ncbi:MAG: hypothetical protein IJ234_01360 [Clostridia bacterium]|nr:hypothetical protein [Clostridia bacterium]
MKIPEADKVCINCRHLYGLNNDEETCGGRECCNWDEKYTENFFEPDEDYIRDDVANCNNCAHQHQLSICEWRSRLEREDLWEERR